MKMESSMMFLCRFCICSMIFFLPFSLQAKSVDFVGLVKGYREAEEVPVKQEVKYTPSAEENGQARKYGWQMSFDLKLATGGHIANYYANGATRFRPLLSINKQGDLQVELEGEAKPVILAKGTEALDWHSYDVVFYPGPAASVSFYVDGRLVRGDWKGRDSQENAVVWGKELAKKGGEAWLRHARFEVHGDYVFKDQDRIPSLIVSRKTPGVVALFAERRVGGGDPGSKDNTNDMMTRVSRDFGETWTEPTILTAALNKDKQFDFSDPRPIYLEKEDRFLLSYARWPTDAGQNGAAVKPWLPGGVMTHVYDVAGSAWSVPVDVSDQVKERSFQIIGWGGAEFYERDSSLAKNDVWTLGADLRVYNGDGNVVFASDGEKEFRVTYAVDDRKELTVRLNGQDQAIAVQSGKNRGATVFQSRLSYDPASGKARLSIDGDTVAEWAGVPSTERKIGFGQADASQDGRIHINAVWLEKGGARTIDFDARALTVLDPKQHTRDPEKLGWTKVVTGNAYSFYGVASINPGPGHGIELSYQTAEQGGHNGRLIYPAIVLDRTLLNVASVYSDDRGKSWSVGAELPIPYRVTDRGLETLQPTESDLVERKDGCLLLTARLDFNRVVNGVDYGPRHQFVSCNAGLTWDMSREYDSSQFPGISFNSVDASITRFVEKNGESYLLFINPMGKEEDKKELNGVTLWGGRDNLGIWFSFDEGQSWKGPIQIVNGGSAYSDIHQLDDKRAMIIFEDNQAGMRTIRLPVTLVKQKINK